MIRFIDIALPVVTIALVVAWLLFSSKLPRKYEVRYNCDLAEISPDIPVQVKQQCRELRAKQ